MPGQDSTLAWQFWESQFIPQWQTPISVQGDGNQFNLAFGGHPDATDGFDQNLDVVAAPPGQNYYAYFSIASPVSYLSTDYRGWVAPYDVPRTWLLNVVNTAGISSEVSWDGVALPPKGSFILKLASQGIEANMRQQSSVQFTGDAVLRIEYQPITCVTYDFNIQGGAWYFISLPVVPPDNSVSTLFPAAIAAFGWDYASQSYVPAANLEPGKAYWLLMLQAAAVEVCGTRFETYTHNYTALGWDMTGSVLQSSALVDNPAQSVLAMFGWDATAGQYVTLSPYTVEPKQGYWILVYNAPSSVTVGGAVAATAKAGAGADLSAFYAKYGTQPPAPPYELAGNKFAPIPESFGLSQNYPNPFNPETVIEYQLPAAGRVSLKIYDMMGREVRTLVQGEQPAGYHRVQWDGRDQDGKKLNSGVYLYRIEAGSFSQTRKVVLLK